MEHHVNTTHRDDILQVRSIVIKGILRNGILGPHMQSLISLITSAMLQRWFRDLSYNLEHRTSVHRINQSIQLEPES